MVQWFRRWRNDLKGGAPRGGAVKKVARAEHYNRHAHFLCEYVLKESVDRMELDTSTFSSSIFYKSL